jgi:hypothetical protein
MLNIIDYLCFFIWLIFLGINEIFFSLIYFLIFGFVFIWACVCRMGALGKACKKVEGPFKIIWRFSFLLIIDTIFSCYKQFLDYAWRTKNIKRIFAIFVLILTVYLLYMPSHANTQGWRLYQKGIASWYGPGFYWKTKADGTTYHPWDLSAASKTLPLGTMVKVVNLDNGKIVYVKIDDRGPYVKNRILDLSYAAAKKMDIINKGLAKVAIYVPNVIKNGK